MRTQLRLGLGLVLLALILALYLTLRTRELRESSASDLDAAQLEPEQTALEVAPRFEREPAPRAQDSVVPREERPELPRLLFCGRLVDAQHGALPNLRIAARWTLGARTAGCWTTTDAEARFRFLVRTEGATFLDELLLLPVDPATLHLPEGAIEQWARARCDRIELPPSGTVELGDLALAQPESHLHGAGVVVANDGSPIVGAEIGGVSVWPPAEAPPYEEHSWIEAMTRSDAHGAFRLRTWKPCRAIRWTVSAPGFYMPRILVTNAGRTDLRIVLHRGADLSGSVKLEPDLPTTQIEVILRPSSGRACRTRVDADGQFHFLGLPPERYVLSFQLHRMGPPLREIRDVIATEGINVRDERLREVDLRGTTRHLALRILDGDGSGAAFRDVSISRGDGPGSAHALTNQRGELRLLLPSAVDTVDVSDNGEPIRVSWRPELQEVRLVSRCLARIELEEQVALPPGAVLGMRLRALEDNASASSRANDHELDLKLRGGEAAFFVPRPARYSVDWNLTSQFAHEPRIELPLEVPPVLDLTALERKQILRLAPPIEQLRAALDVLGY